MQRIIRKSSLLITLFFLAMSAGAQELKMTINYNIATPISTGFRDYVSKTSFRGVQGALLYEINDQWRVGLQLAYNDFYQKYPRAVYKTSDGADISTVLSNTMQNVPVLAKGEYSFTKNTRIRPYVGLGAGVNIAHYIQYLGEFPYSKYYTKPALSGDIGVLVPFHPESQSGLRLSSSYNFSPFNEEGIKSLDTWNVQLGLVFPIK